MAEVSIKAKTLMNARDLGGIPVRGGRTVKHGLLIRSNALADAKDADVKKLIKAYELGLVIDLRSSAEVKKREDPLYLLPRVKYVNIPLTEGNEVGIVRKGGLAETIAMARMIENDPAQMMKNMYVEIVTSMHGQRALRMVFDLLLKEDACTLWHCTAGKDRAGITAAMILFALGASREDVLEDYLLTNEHMDHYEKVQRRQLMLTPQKIKDNLPVVNDANKTYFDAAFDTIDEQYGGIDRYLSWQIGLTQEELARLRERFTE